MFSMFTQLFFEPWVIEIMIAAIAGALMLLGAVDARLVRMEKDVS
jgi:uncharacterized integral membrane protein